MAISARGRKKTSHSRHESCTAGRPSCNLARGPRYVDSRLTQHDVRQSTDRTLNRPRIRECCRWTTPHVARRSPSWWGPSKRRSSSRSWL